MVTDEYWNQLILTQRITGILVFALFCGILWFIINSGLAHICSKIAFLGTAVACIIGGLITPVRVAILAGIIMAAFGLTFSDDDL